MERRQTWIAAAAVMVSVVLSAIGATWTDRSKHGRHGNARGRDAAAERRRTAAK